jgi:succinylglutamate desuccinylase
MSATTLTAPPATTSHHRSIGRLSGAEPGPTLIVVGSMHGNEPAGSRGLRRALERLERGDAMRRELRGEVVGLAGNLAALEQGSRYVVHDLNRIWSDERIERVRAAGGDQGGSGLTVEEAEMRHLDAEIGRALAAARAAGRPAFLLDLHTTSGGGPAFCVLEDTLPMRRFALALEAPLVLGLEEELSGTLTHWLADRGVVAVGFEAGQHEDPAAVERAEAAVWLALEAAGCLAPGVRPEVEEARRRLAAERRGLPRVVEVRYRHPVMPGDDFRMAPGYATFTRVDAGQSLAVDRGGAVTTPQGGLLLMPLYQRQGDDGFFIVRQVAPAWLALSTRLRRLRLERVLHLLPGVRRHPGVAGSFLVDRRVARFLALDLFHLLGFRRRGPATGRHLAMTRRAHDV